MVSEADEAVASNVPNGEHEEVAFQLGVADAVVGEEPAEVFKDVVAQMPPPKSGKKRKDWRIFFTLMDSTDLWYWRCGVFSAMVGGLRFPIMSLFVGDSLDKLGTATGGYEEAIIPVIVRLVALGAFCGFFKAVSDVSIAIVQVTTRERLVCLLPAFLHDRGASQNTTFHQLFFSFM